MTVPFDRASNAADEVKKGSTFIIAEWEKWTGVSTHPDVVQAHERHVEGLRDAWRILTGISHMPPADMNALYELHAKDPAVFEAIMVLVRIELERPAPAETKVAA